MIRTIALAVCVVVLFTQISVKKVVADTSSTVAVTVSASYYKDGVLISDPAWDSATYTYPCIKGDSCSALCFNNKASNPPEHGTLTNGAGQSFSYEPSNGRMFKFYHAPDTDRTDFIVIPSAVAAFSFGGTDYPKINTTIHQYNKYFFINGRNMKEVIMAEGFTAASDYALSQPAEINRIQFPTTIQTIGANVAFQNSGGTIQTRLNSVEIPGAISIGTDAFRRTKVNEVVFPENLKTLGSGVFYDNNNLAKVIFKGNVETIGANAFYLNSKLSEMTFEGDTAPTISPRTAGTYDIDAAAYTLTVNYPSNGKGYTEDAFRERFPPGTVFKPFLTTPAVIDPKIQGSPVIGRSLTSSYTYTDPLNRAEGDSIAVWKSASDALFDSGVNVLKTETVTADTASSLTITEDLFNKYISLSITPKCKSGTANTIGDEVTVYLAAPIRFEKRIPTVAISSPQDGDAFIIGNQIPITSTAYSDSADITKVEYYAKMPFAVAPEDAVILNKGNTSVPEQSLIYNVRINGEDGITPITYTLANNTSITAEADLHNHTALPKDAAVMLAVYGAEGLIAVSVSEIHEIPPDDAVYPPISVKLPLTKELRDAASAWNAFVLNPLTLEPYYQTCGNPYCDCEICDGSCYAQCNENKDVWVLIGSADTSPFQYSWDGLGFGTYPIRAKAYNNYGESELSEIITCTVTPISDLKVFGQNGIMEITNSIEGNSKISARAVFQNPTNDTLTVTIRAELYNKNGEAIEKSNVYTIAPNSKDTELTVTLDNITEAISKAASRLEVVITDGITEYGVPFELYFVQAGVFEELRLKWKNILTGGDKFDPNAPYIKDKVALIATDAQNAWDVMNKNSVRNHIFTTQTAVKSNSAQVTRTFRMLTQMALAHETIGAEGLYKNEELRSDIINALEWMNKNVYSASLGSYGNWWDWDIGAAQALIDGCILLYDYLTEEQIGRYMGAVGRHAYSIDLSGANRMWQAKVIAGRGILTDNPNHLIMVKRGMSNIFGTVVHWDGFYADGSFIQHGYFSYNGGYGLDLVDCMADIIYVLHGTEWQLTEIARHNIFDWALKAYQPFLYKGALMDMVRGREVSRSGTSSYVAGHKLMGAIVRLSQFAPEKYATAFKSLIKYNLMANDEVSYYVNASMEDLLLAEAIMGNDQIQPADEPIMYRQFANMDRAVQLRPGYGVGLSMFSNRIQNYESINSENAATYHTGSGMLSVYNNDVTQFDGTFWPTVNKYRLPGTTVLDGVAVSANRHSDRSWVGGVALGDMYGVSGMDTHFAAMYPAGEDIEAKKSWFMFDDEIVALGAGINSKTATNKTAVTTVENRKLPIGSTAKLTVNGAVLSDAEMIIDNVSSAHLEGRAVGSDIGYYFPSPTTIKTLRENRTGTWSSLNSSGSTTVQSDDYQSIVIDHGVNAENASYAYAILPGKTAAETLQYKDAHDFKIIANTSDVQAVREDTLGIIGANFWTDTIQTADILTCDKKASVMVRSQNNKLTVVLSDPTQENTGDINIEIAVEGKGVLSKDERITVTQMTPFIKFTANVNLLRGASIEVVFADDVTSDSGVDEYIIDNTDSGFSVNGAWTNSTAWSDYYGTDFMIDSNANANEGKWAKWTPDIEKAGVYDVYMRWPANEAAPSDTPITVVHSGGVDGFNTANQRLNPGIWVYVGRYNFDAGTNGYVMVHASTQNRTVADAVKFVAR